MIKYLALAIIGLALYSCASKTPPTPPTPPETTTASVEVLKTTTTSSEIVAQGKSLYEANCAKCHKLFEPSDFSATKWHPIVQKMAKRAKLSNDDRDKVYAYLIH